MKGYDSHFIIEKAHGISNRIGNPNIYIYIYEIPNSEKLMSFSLGH